ncbi:translocation/assembly module TamB domain-containing protein [Thermatribacter velox]|uniref:Translocation/assembly module TamB domain-containing protein n=1 Tax=Thermatribacter velox TaxID=3039681 RepID=A0ABZ2YAQ9_9BACT
MGKSLLWILVALGLVAAVGAVYVPLQYGLQDAFLSWTASLPDVHFDFEKVRLAGPGSLAFENLRITGKGFALYFPRAFFRVRFLSWLGLGKGPVFLVSSNQVRLQVIDLSFLQAFAGFDFQKLPSFSFRVEELILEGKRRFSLENAVFARDAEGFRFSAFKGEAKISGHFNFDRTVAVDFAFPLQGDSWQGELRYSLSDGMLWGRLNSPLEASLESALVWDEEKKMFSLDSISLKSAEDAFSFQGRGSVDFSEKSSLLEGKIQGLGGKVFELDVQALFDEEPLRALWCLKEEASSTSLQGELRGGNDQKLYFQVKPGSLLQGVGVAGEGYLGFENGELVLELSSASCSLDGNPFWSGLEGKGALRGTLRFGKEGLENGHLFFASDALNFKEWQLEKPRLELRITANGTASVSGEAVLFGGTIQLAGTWRQGSFDGKGAFSQVSLQSLVASFANLPLGGTLDGKIDIKGEKDELRFTFLLKGGEIFWGSSYLAEVSEGQLLFKSVNDLEAQLNLKGKEGEAQAFLTRKGERLEVALRLRDFLFEADQDGYQLAFQASGDLELEKGEGEQAFRVALHAPLWRWAGFEGKDLAFEGFLEDEKIAVQVLETRISELGRLKLSGWVIPAQEVSLEGEIAGVTLPENQFALQGKLEEGSLSIKGPWERVTFALQGKGNNLLLRGRQLGESFEVLFEGNLKLPGKGEHLPLTSYLSPENWNKGFVRVVGLDLRSLGISLLERYQIESSGNLFLELDSSSKNWMLRVEELTFSYPKLPLLLGSLQGRFDGKKLVIEDLSLKDTSGNLKVGLDGMLDLEENLVDVNCLLTVEPFLEIPWQDFLLQLCGEGRIRFWGKLEQPQVGGDVFLREAKILQSGREVLALTSVEGQITQEKLHITRGEAVLSGISGVLSGDLTREGLDVALSFRGDCSQLGLGEALSGQLLGEAKLSGSWKQPLLQGSLLVEDGRWDHTYPNRLASEDTGFSLASVEQVLLDLPVDIELELKTSSKPFVVKTRFMEVALAGNLLLRAGNGESSLSGTLQVVDGMYNLVMRKIPLAGKVYFGELFDLEPQLDLYGSCEVDGYKIRLTAQGPLSTYQLKLASEPALSREEILSLLFTGDRNAYASLSDINVGPLFWELFSFLTGGKGDFLSSLSGFLNLEINPVFSNGSWFYELTLEKRLGNDLVIGYTQDLSGGEHSAVYFDLNVNENWSFKTEVDKEKGLSWELEFTTRF